MYIYIHTHTDFFDGYITTARKSKVLFLWEKERTHIRQAKTTVSVILSLGKHCEGAYSILGIGLSHMGNMDKAEVSLLGTSDPWGT